MGSLTHFQMTFFKSYECNCWNTNEWCLLSNSHDSSFWSDKKINIFLYPSFLSLFCRYQTSFWPISHLFRRCVCMFLCTLCIICLTKCLHFQSLDLFFLVLWSFCGQPKWSPYLKEKAILTLEESWILIRERCLSFWDSRLIILLYPCVTVWSLNLVLFESVWKKSWIGIMKEV